MLRRGMIWPAAITATLLSQRHWLITSYASAITPATATATPLMPLPRRYDVTLQEALRYAAATRLRHVMRAANVTTSHWPFHCLRHHRHYADGGGCWLRHYACRHESLPPRRRAAIDRDSCGDTAATLRHWPSSSLIAALRCCCHVIALRRYRHLPVTAAVTLMLVIEG